MLVWDGFIVLKVLQLQPGEPPPPVATARGHVSDPLQPVESWV